MGCEKVRSDVVSISARINCVAIGPGETTASLIPESGISSASENVNARRPNLLAEYAALPGTGVRPASEATFMIAPPPDSRTFPLPRIAHFIRSAENPPVTVMMVAKANPLVQVPDSRAMQAAFDRVPFKIVVDMFMTDTARAADLVAHRGEGGIDKETLGAALFQKGAEEHEYEHEGGGHPDGQPENTLGGQPVVGHALGQAGPLVGNDFRHELAAEGINDKDRCDDHQWRTQCTAGGFEQQDESKHRNHQVHLGRHARAVRQLVVEQEQIAGTEGPGQAQNPFLKRNITGRRGFERRESSKRQE